MLLRQEQQLLINYQLQCGKRKKGQREQPLNPIKKQRPKRVAVVRKMSKRTLMIKQETVHRPQEANPDENRNKKRIKIQKMCRTFGA